MSHHLPPLALSFGELGLTFAEGESIFMLLIGWMNITYGDPGLAGCTLILEPSR